MNILLAGVGGQGTVLASKVLAQCAADKGLSARTAETIGMAQRGGSVFSHVRIGRDVFSPLIPKGAATLLIGFEPAEAVRALDFLSPGGTVIVSGRAIRPAILPEGGYSAADMIRFLAKRARSGEIGRVFVTDAEAVARAVSHRALNVALLGAAAGVRAFDFTGEDLEAALRSLMPERFADDNRRALELGAAVTEAV